MRRHHAPLAILLLAVLATSALAFDVEFTVIDGTQSYQDIQLKGTFTDWMTVPMDDADGDHTWTVTVDVPPGDHEWGAIENDGTEWGIWLLPPGPNLELTVGADGTVEGQTVFEIPVPGETVDVTFMVDMNAEVVAPEGVRVRGSFLEWDIEGAAMLDPDGDGIYAVTIAVEESTSHAYVFLNGDDYETVPAECGVDNGFGGYNRWIEVHAADMGDQTAAWVFNGCDVPVSAEASTLSDVKALYR